jgi:phenylalanyl-tRNA synthetase beta chain
VDRALDEEMLVIADAERAVAVGGVMGGQESEIGPTTTRMVLESACFTPASIRRTSKRLGLRTEASTRFERGTDFWGPVLGLARAASLLQEIGAARPGVWVDVVAAPRTDTELVLRASRIPRVLGMDVPGDHVQRILSSLGFGVQGYDPSFWIVTVPTFRVDVTREIDLIEEVGRHFGFDKLPTTFPALTAAQAPPDPRIERDRLVRRTLASAGLSESMTFAFIERDAAVPFCEAGVEPAAIANPLSEKFAVLRPSLLPGLIDSCAHNRRRGRKDVRLFETGSRFTAAGEGRAAGLVWSGSAVVAHWSGEERAVDFFDVKGVVELVCLASAIEDVEFAPSNIPFLVPGRAALLTSGGSTLGVAGQLLPSIAEQRGMPAGEEVYVAEIDMDALASRIPQEELRTASLPKFPGSVRDLSILVAEALPAAAVRGTIRSAAPDFLQSIVEFDRYQGKGIPEGSVSLSLRLTFRSAERTLTDDDVDAAMHAIVTALERAHDAKRR